MDTWVFRIPSFCTKSSAQRSFSYQAPGEREWACWTLEYGGGGGGGGQIWPWKKASNSKYPRGWIGKPEYPGGKKRKDLLYEKIIIRKDYYMRRVEIFIRLWQSLSDCPEPPLHIWQDIKIQLVDLCMWILTHSLASHHVLCKALREF